MFSFDCDTCSDVKIEDRINGDCVKCKFSAIILANLYFPANVTLGDYHKKRVSCDGMYMFIKHIVKTRCSCLVYESHEFAYNAEIVELMRKEFPMLQFVFRGNRVCTVAELYSDVLRYVIMVRLHLNGAVLVSYNDTLGKSYPVDYDDNLYSYKNSVARDSLDDVIANMASAGIKMMWGVTTTDRLVDLRYYADTDFHYHERPYHYRLMNSYNGALAYVIFANENHRPMVLPSVPDVPHERYVPEIDLTEVIRNIVSKDNSGEARIRALENELAELKLKSVDRRVSSGSSLSDHIASPPPYEVVANCVITVDDDDVFGANKCSPKRLDIPIKHLTPLQTAGSVKLVYIPDGFNETSAMLRPSRDRLSYINLSMYDDGVGIVHGNLYYTDDIDLVTTVCTSASSYFKFIGTYYVKGYINESIKRVDRLTTIVMCRNELNRQSNLNNLLAPLRKDERYYIGYKPYPGASSISTEVAVKSCRDDDVVVTSNGSTVDAVTDFHDQYYCYKIIFREWDDEPDDSRFLTSREIDKAVSKGYALSGKKFSVVKVSDGYYHVDYGDKYTSTQVYSLLSFMVKR